MKTTISSEQKLEILDLICEGWGAEMIAIHLNLPTSIVLDYV